MPVISNKLATLLDICPQCNNVRYVQPSRKGRLCKSCSNARTAAKQKKYNVYKRGTPVSLTWQMKCSNCGLDVKAKRLNKPTSIMCIICIAKIGNAASIAALANIPKTLCIYGGCDRFGGRRSRLCHKHYAHEQRLSKPQMYKAHRINYYINNRDVIIARGKARNIGKIHSDPIERKRLTSFYNNLRTAEILLCSWCGKETSIGNRHGDHVIPLSKGGKHCIDNLCCACKSCNLHKREMMPEEFIKWLERNNNGSMVN